MHPATSRDSLFRGLAAVVAPGGTLLIAGHHPAHPRTGVAHAAVAHMRFTPEKVAAGPPSNEWEIVVAEARPRTITDPHGREVIMRDTVLRARRRS
ncbi:hypothetical protein SAMN02745673_01756 [Marinactinospora thermotolerans DSM 45154]|uniref:Methyltransferase domain-containing protein n=1 Tax=Marinactinospora thermotolerans DSM 45154 TaxID=1122192 RepID=A0A1T4PD90_9ACTN|nr:hypothetical protein [Marinactinospora thermotolerans]SJZ89545.1 hypothetical protein SAMN02745673_01756 [Marinactinospora thermotolerans DSM 45154]